MAVLVVTAHRKPPAVQPQGQCVVTSHVFTQAMHQQHRAALELAARQRPVVTGQHRAVVGGKGREGEVGCHVPASVAGSWAITWATAAVSFLA